MAKKLTILSASLLLVAGGVCAHALAKPSAPAPEAEVYVLDQVFFVDLDEGRAAMVRVGLLVDDFEPAATVPPDAMASAVVTDVLTGASADKLLSPKGRRTLQARILEQIERKSDIELTSVLFPDLTIQ
jgi:hypothetical protein